MKKIILAFMLLMGTGAYATYDFPICEACEDGVDGVDGVDGTDGINGTDGTNGSDGVDGEDGLAGADGTDGTDFNSKAYTAELSSAREEVRNATELANQAVAGSTALSAIDFGSTCKGKTEVGFGVGVADSYVGSDYAGGVGIKHGVTESTALIAKGWKSKRATAGAVAVTYAF